jgi:hypothetical protein
MVLSLSVYLSLLAPNEMFCIAEKGKRYFIDKGKYRYYINKSKENDI